MSAGLVVYIPQKQPNGSITYHYAGNVSVNNNAATGEYNMNVPNADGGQTIYTRVKSGAYGEFGYIVEQVSTNATGEITYQSKGWQQNLDSDLKSISVFSLNAQGNYDGVATVGNTVVEFDAEYDAARQKFRALELNSIGGNDVSGLYGDFNSFDLLALGLQFDAPFTNTAADTVAGLNPTTLAANGQPTPTVVQTPLSNGTQERTIELPNGVSLTTISSSNGTPLRIEETRTQGDQVSTTTYTINPDGSRTGSLITVGVYSSKGAFIGQQTDLSTNTVYDINREPNGQEIRTVNTNATTGIVNQQGIAVLNNVASFITAIQGGRPVPILTGGLQLLNTVVNPTIGNQLVLNNSTIYSATTVFNGLTSLYNLSNALRNGDTLTQINATLNTINYVNTSLPQLLNGPGTAAFSPGLNTLLNGNGGLAAGNFPGVLPVLGLILSIRSGDPIGIISGLIGILNPALLATPPVGWILAGASILRALFGNKAPPEAWGTGKFILDANGNIAIDVVGESFGRERVSQQLGLTQQILSGLMAQALAASPGTPLGLIAQRTPILTWREARQSDKGYAIVDIDPVTGTQRYPYLRFDDNGVPFSSNPAVWQPDPLDEGIRISMTEQLLNSALRRQAIAPQWEVDTAKIQDQVGDPNAGLTEQERAAKQGQGATYDPVTKQPKGQFRPIALDLDPAGTASAGGSGRIDTIAKDDANNTVAFDWDGSGFKKQVAWVKPHDGFLFLDHNANGVVDDGSELFSNSLVSDNVKGVKSLDWVDANRDHKITNLDPVFKQLKVWQDVNQDGDNVQQLDNGSVVQDAGELKTLTELGITELDFVNASYTRNGAVFAMKSDQLEADANGTRINVVQSGIQIQNSNGTTQLIVTQVNSLGNGGDLIPNQFEDGSPAPSTTPQEITIFPSLLLANDAETPAGLSVVQVKNAKHGTVRLGDSNGQPAIFFTPQLNYNSAMGEDASFEYVVLDASGATKTNLVKIPLLAVNDLPVVSDVPDAQRAIYGYKPYTYSYTYYEGGRDNGNDVTISGTRQGDPIYQPYIEEIKGAPITGELYRDGPTVTIGYEPSTFIPHNTIIAYDSPNTGAVTATDPDGASSFTYELVGQSIYGKAVVDSATGRWSYVGRRPAGIELGDVTGDGQTDYGNADTNQVGGATGNIDSNRYGKDEGSFQDAFTVRVKDAAGGVIDKTIEVTHYGPRPLPEVQSGAGKKPIAVDLDGNGFQFKDVNDSNVFLDVNGDGWKRKTAWIAPGDGLLALDDNGNGKIDSGLEISFSRFKKGAQTDLEGLRAFDTNGDGQFTALDAQWGKFGIWRDANSNGVTDAGEFKSLADWGISQMALTSDGQFQVINGQTVHGVGNVTKTDGTTLAFADVTLKYSDQVQTGTDASGNPVTTNLVATQKGQIFNGTGGKDLVFGTVGSDNFLLGDGDDVVVDDQGDDRVDAGAGDDMVNTGVGNDVVLAGAGNDQVFAGEGNDVVFGDDGTAQGNDVIMLQGGNDVAFGGGGNDFISGGTGNDIISGDAGNDQLFGEDGWDVLFGNDGNDELRGMNGNDLLSGGAGNDLLDGGADDDVMQGGAGDDTYVVNAAADVVDETTDGQIDGTLGTIDAGGNDTVRASINYTLGTLLENLSLEGDAAQAGTGNAQDNVLQGNRANNSLFGLAGSDRLDGGLGADYLAGGTGDDVYEVDNLGDTVVEAAGEGQDTVRSRISYALTANVENLSLVGSGAINAVGNALGNVMTGNTNANILDGGAGNDTLAGGKGNDSYKFGRGYGVDTVIDREGQNTLIFSEGIAATDLRFSLGGAQGSDLLIDVTNAGSATADRVILQGWYIANTAQRAGAQRVSAVRFADGSIVPLDESALNRAPTVVADSDSMTEDSVLASGNVLANDSDPDAGNILSVVGAGTYVGQYGTLVLSANGSYRYTLRSGDADVQALQRGTAVTDRFTFSVTDNAPFERATLASELAITITGSNDAPVLAQAITAQAATESVAFRLALPVGSFTDADAGDTLSYVATYADGSPLPAWLRFDAATQTFSGEPAYEDISAFYGQAAQALNLRVTATDSQGASASAVFSLTINQSPELILVGTDGADTLRGASRNDQLFGGAGNDILRGMRGDDLLDGGAGADQMAGGLGDDRYVVDNAGDVVTELAGEGTDSVSASVDYTLTANVENLSLSGSQAINATGNTQNNILTGNSAANTLDGGLGADTLQGGQGNDLYIVESAGDVVTELAGEGTDSVNASIDYTLTANVENLTLSGTALRATGNGLANTLTGNAQDNVLDGGAGADTMAGGLGNDSYRVDHSADQITELAGQGTDSVLATANYTLSANVENLTLAGSAVQGTGNESANTLTANDLGNTLSGLAGNDTLTGSAGNDLLDGGTGADQMAGGLGDDSYVVDNAGDVVAEFFNQGYDQVTSAINYVLPEHAEKLSLTGSALTASGNSLNNVLIGNALANILDGATGADQMAGGLGDDRYVADNAGDVVTELQGEGNDTVYASVNYSTAAHVEHLILTGQALTASGNALSNVLVGNDKANSLSGGEGADLLAGWLGDDSLDGGSGNDTYLWNQGDGRDTLTDVSGTDSVRFGVGISLNSLSAREYTSSTGQRRIFISVLDASGEERADQGVDFALNATTTATGTVYSSPIESFKLGDGTSFTLDQVKPALVTTLGGNGNDTLTGSRADDTMDAGNGNDTLYGRTGNDTLYGSNGQDKLFGEGGNDKLYGGNDSDWLYGGTGQDVLYGENGDDELWAGSGNDKLYGGNDGDLLTAGAGDDLLYGDNGADVMVAGAGNDTVWAGNDNDFIDAGAGNDVVNGELGNDFIAGGKGNDTIDAGMGNDVIAFNRGDGQDTLLGMDWQQDVLSLGGGIRYTDISLSKAGNDLVLGLGQGDQITLKDWYNGSYNIRSQVNRLQLVTAATGGDYNAASSDRLLNKKVVDFDFLKLVSDFDAARAANPTAAGGWAVQAKLNNAYLAASNTQAIGGDLAYRYATLNDAASLSANGGASYGDVDWRAVASRMGTMGSALQNLTTPASTGNTNAINPWIALQAGTNLVVEQATGASLPIQVQGPLTQEQLITQAFNSQQQINAQTRPSWV